MCKLQILPVVSGYKVDGGFMNLLWVFAQVTATPTGLCSKLLKSISHLLGWGILQNPGWVHQSGLFIFLASNWLFARSSIWTVVLGGVRIGYHSNHIWYRNRLEPVFDCSFENQLLSKSFMHLNFFQHIQDLVLWCFFLFLILSAFTPIIQVLLHHDIFLIIRAYESAHAVCLFLYNRLPNFFTQLAICL